MRSHITVEEVPRLGANVEGIREISRKVSESEGRVHNAAVTIVNSWRSIPERFEAPFSPSIGEVIQPLDFTTNKFGTAIVMFKQATETFANELSILLNRRGTLIADIEDFVHDVQRQQRNFPEQDWSEGKGLSDRNTNLRHRCVELQKLAESTEDDYCRSLAKMPTEADISSGLGGAAAAFGGATAALPSWAARETSFDRALRDSARFRLNHLSSLNEAELKKWVAANPDIIHELVDSADPTVVAKWWAKIAEQPALAALLIASAPLLIGGLDGLPPQVRVAANVNVAKARIDEINEELQHYEEVPHIGSKGTVEALNQELLYLRRAVNGEVQLYLYDNNRDRVIEMFGNPETATQRLTWVPGTLSTLGGFYDGTLTALPGQIATADPTALIFVTKDGTFPQLDIIDPLTLSPANTELMNELGSRVARFEAGMDSAGFSDMNTVLLGHSAGLAIATAAETHGATVNTVISLSGAGMNSDWRPNPGTTYLDITPDVDVIRAVRETAEAAGQFTDGFMGFPQVPEAEFGFTEIDPELGRDTDSWSGSLAFNSQFALPGVPTAPFVLPESVGNHNQITSTETTDVARDAIVDALLGRPVEGRVRH